MSDLIPVACALDCPDTCGLLAEVEDGRLVRVRGNPEHPFTRGFTCVKMRHYPERHYHPDRPLHPMRRKGPKGGGEWERLSWDQALDEIAERLKTILDQHGGEAVLPYHYGGNHGLVQGSHAPALFRAIGASELKRTICASAGTAGWKASYGNPTVCMDPEDIARSRFIMLWGTNTMTTNVHLLPILKEARQAGAKIVHVDCYTNRTSGFADQLVRVKPGSDGALAYGMAHVIIEEGLHDIDYLTRSATGFEAYARAAKEWSPARAAEKTGVPADTIITLARSFAAQKNSAIRVSYGMTRHPGGGGAFQAVSLLPALTGAWQVPGGGVLASTSGVLPLNKSALGGQDLTTDPANPSGYFRPNPNARQINMSQIGTALHAAKPSIAALFVFNANPAVVAPDSDRVRAGLLREDLLTVVLENAPTETAALADYILPATTFFEHEDICASYGHFYLSWSQKAVNPAGESRPNTEIFADLARRLDIDAPAIYWNAETVAEQLLKTDHPHLGGINLAALKERGFMRARTTIPFLPFADGALTTSGKIVFDPPPKVLMPEPDERFPLILITPPAHHFLNTTFGHVDSLVSAEGPRPVLLIHPTDAAVRGLEHGDLARLQSATGEIERHVEVTEETAPGTLVAEGIWWGKSAPDLKSVNAIVGEDLTDMGEGPVFHGTTVQATKVPG
jgi:anaerobic selenocysteine-containing dehydrogenase